ncbi:MAG: branched-chain amino acid ABC transporter permease [Candidatus Paceibacterota bacterium]|jgi:branched-chain amino acid transport system permease protein
MEYWQLILYAISATMLFSVLAMGFGFILRSTKFFNIVYGGAFLIGGYMMFLFYRILSFNFFIAFILSILISGLYFLFSYKFIFSPLLKQKASNFVLLIASFGLLTATSAIIGMFFGNQTTLIARHLSDIYTVNIFGTVLNIIQIFAIVISPILICIFAFVYFKTRFGRAIRAIEDDKEMAELVGVPSDKIFLAIFFIGGTLAGLGGIAEGFDVGIMPSSALFYMLPVIVATVVGGIKSFWGAILGTFILVLAQKLTIIFLGGSWEQAVPFVILIIMLLFRPEGILKK